MWRAFVVGVCVGALAGACGECALRPRSALERAVERGLERIHRAEADAAKTQRELELLLGIGKPPQGR